MELPGESSSLSNLQRLKTDLKQWEREFQKQNGRVPSKQDIQASPSTHSLYREYARMKVKIQNENENVKNVSQNFKTRQGGEKENSHTGWPGGGRVKYSHTFSTLVNPEDSLRSSSKQVDVLSGERVEPVIHRPKSRSLIFLGTSSSSEDSEDGSYVSATPPKRSGSKLEPQSTPISSYRPLRRPLKEISAGQLNSAPTFPHPIPSKVLNACQVVHTSKRKSPEGDIPKVLTSTPAVNFSDRILSNVDNSLELPELPQELGFVIKRRRPGMLLDEQTFYRELDILPAGFSASVWGSNLTREECKKSSVVANESITSEADKRTPGESSTANSCILTPSLGNQENSGGTGDNHTIFNKFSRIGSSASHAPIKVQDERASATQQLASNLQPQMEVAGNSNSPANIEVEPKVTTRDLDRELSGRPLQKLTVVTLKQMLLNRGIRLVGKKAILISRLSAALSAEAAGDCPSAEKVDGENCEQIEKVTVDAQFVKQSEKEAINGTRKVESDCDAEKGDVELGKSQMICLGKVDLLNSLSAVSSGDVNDSISPRMSNKKIKLEKQPEEQSWSKPKALQRRPWTRNTKGISGRSSSCGKVHTQTIKPGERNNFVKLNIRGRGGGRRKFVNKSQFRKPGAYGRRGHRGKKSRKTAPDETDDAVEHDLLHADEVDKVCALGEKGSRFKRTKSTSIAMDTWIEADTSHFSVPDCTEDSKGDLPPGLSEALKRVLHDPSNDNLLEVLELAFGFKVFRAGQLEAVKRVLALQSAMVMLPTGAGKSLCYQLPALVLPGVTLVISPLVALMTDQLHHLPPSLPGALMSSAQTYQESSSIVARVRAGLIKVLFISPERLCSESFQRVLTEIPKINLAVIDEAHCLSEWSHNFRPSYFRLGSVLLQQMKVPCILAMTATATKRAERSIMEALRIPSTGLVQASHVRENVVLTVSKEPNRLRALLRMLQDSPYSEFRSIIIYCTFQVEADNISDFLQQSGIQAKSYHAKKTSHERSRTLDQFCSNKLRVVVATVAFGMGLDKSDVRAVIHYNMPRSLEHYVQETGRAGRDGEPAICHLFLDDNDYLKLRSLAHRYKHTKFLFRRPRSEGMDEYAVGKVLYRIFHGKQESSKLDTTSSIIIETATKEFDIKEEVLETILSYLEVGDVEYVKSVSKLNVTCALSFHRSSPASLAETSSLVAAILRRSQEKQGRYVFDMLSLAARLQLSMCDMQFELRRLQVAGEISCEYGDPAFCFTISRLPEDVCLLTSAMTKRLNDVETNKVRKVNTMYTAALAAVCRKNEGAMEESNSSFSSQQASFQDIIKQYFDDNASPYPARQLPSIIEPSRNFLRADIKDFVRSNKHARLTARAVARIFYGIWSPAFPYSDWSKNHSWGKYVGLDFGVIKDIATAELLSQHSATRVLQNS